MRKIHDTLFLAVLFFCHYCHALSIFSLTPQTTPEEIVMSQLKSLQKDDMQGVFDFASPSNKANVNNDLNAFDRMVRRGAYAYLVRHQEAQILLTMTTPTLNVWQGLVRVVPAELDPKKSTVMNNEKDEDEEEDEFTSKGPKEPTKDYWWTLSRCKVGFHKGCYMVDAVMPSK
jgi:Domain of unknown function (DUF4864)